MIASGLLGDAFYEVHLLNESHIQELMTLQLEVVEALDDKCIWLWFW